MRLSQFITANTKQIVSEWEEFARTCVPAMDLAERRDDVVGMLKAIALDLETPQSKAEQAEKSKGDADVAPSSDTAANAHGTARAATGYTPSQMVAEFRALRASVLRLWSEAQAEFDRASIDQLTRFNEAIDQAIAESITTYGQGVERAKDLFLGILGHDLRNPLGAIIMSTTVMMTQEGPDWPHLRTATRILNNGARMEEIIADLLDFTRTRLGAGIPVVRANMDLQAICQQTVDEITAFHPHCIVKFEASGQLHGKWDRARIGQALSNLIGNAHQHGTANTPIEVSLRGELHEVVLTVRNQGPVIPADRVKDMFNPFQRLDTGPELPNGMASLGLGLYIVQAIVTAHRGKVDVESTESGTIFTVRLPRAAL